MNSRFRRMHAREVDKKRGVNIFWNKFDILSVFFGLKRYFSAVRTFKEWWKSSEVISVNWQTRYIFFHLFSFHRRHQIIVSQRIKKNLKICSTNNIQWQHKKNKKKKGGKESQKYTHARIQLDSSQPIRILWIEIQASSNFFCTSLFFLPLKKISLLFGFMWHAERRNHLPNTNTNIQRDTHSN